MPVAEPQIRVSGRNRDRSPNNAHLPDLRARTMRHVMEPAALEIGLRDRRNAVSHTGVNVNICYVYVSNIHVSHDIVGVPIVAAAPPRMERLIGRQRYPADVVESEPRASPVGILHGVDH